MTTAGVLAVVGIYLPLCLMQVEEEEPTGFIRYEKFQPMMAKVLLERRFVAVQDIL